MTIQGRSEELVSRCVECDLAEPESLASLGGSAPGVVDGILSYSFPLVFASKYALPISAPYRKSQGLSTRNCTSIFFSGA